MVYYEDLNYESLSESEAYGVGRLSSGFSSHSNSKPSFQTLSLISDIGGNMGMWIGLSAIALCEFLELFFDLFLFCLSQDDEVLRPPDPDRAHCRPLIG